MVYGRRARSEVASRPAAAPEFLSSDTAADIIPPCPVTLQQR